MEMLAYVLIKIHEQYIAAWKPLTQTQTQLLTRIKIDKTFLDFLLFLDGLELDIIAVWHSKRNIQTLAFTEII